MRSQYIFAAMVLIVLSSLPLLAQPARQTVRSPVSPDSPGTPGQLPPRGKKLAVPEADEQAKVSEILRDMYAKQFTQAKTPAQKSALANELLAEAGRNADAPVDRYVILRVAVRVGLKAGDLETTLTAINELDSSYLVDVLALKAEAMLALGSAGRSTDTNMMLAEFARDLLTDAASADRYELIDQVGPAATVAVKRSRNANLIRDVSRKVREAKRAQQAYAELKQTLAIVKREPADPAANLIIGQYYAFLKGDWNAGLPHLARCGDEKITSLVQLELAEPRKTKQWIELGDGWAEMAKAEKDKVAQRNMRLHAIDWYQRAVDQLSGFTMLTVKKRIDTLRNEVRKVEANGGR